MAETNENENEQETTTPKPTVKDKAKAAGDKAISAAKRNKGMLVGAAVGTAFMPVVGTVIGGAIGALWD